MTHDERDARLARLAERLAAEGAPDSLDPPDAAVLPSSADVAALLEELLALCLPGFHGEPLPADAEPALALRARLDLAAGSLETVLTGILRFAHQRDCHCEELWAGTGLAAGEGACAAAARRLASDYLDVLPEVRRLMAGDVIAAYEGDPAAGSTEEIILCYPGFAAVAVHRLAHPLHVLGVPLLPRMMSEWAHRRTGVDIHPGATIGPRFFIDHGTGVVVGETTVIGADVKVYQGVTLGALSFRRNADGTLVKGGKRHPTVGDRATVYANATILGGETTVGDDAVIGGGVWVTSSVPAGARVLSRTEPEEARRV